ncbi:MAG: BppU family phage baseplate upper protein, partial [Erysipelothrix sp.]|nr:BppU family phage baseplate upper protein [Erysipelothrix sp.]
IEADQLTYVLGTNEIAAPGKLLASIQLLGANERLTTARFLFRVEKDLITEDAVKSTSEFAILQQLKNELEEIDVVDLTNQFNAHLAESAKIIKVENFGADPTGTNDSTDAFRQALIQSMQTGLPACAYGTSYLITDTIFLSNDDYIYPPRLIGSGGQTTMIRFDNLTPLKNLFEFDTNVNYVHIEGVQIIDVNPRTSRAFYFKDNRVSGSPSWKHYFGDFRIFGFKEGIRWDGDTDFFQDAHLDGVTYMNGKFRNCETAIVFNNIQAVNHNLYSVDFENDDPVDQTEKWKMFKFERGSQVNHLGGSVIGCGPYVWWEPKVPGHFQATHQFKSEGIRHEIRGANPAPTYHHSESSSISIDSFFRIIIKNATVVVLEKDNADFIKTGGRCYIDIDGFKSSRTMRINGVMTTNYGNAAQYGQIKVRNAEDLSYVRTKEIAYGSSTLPPTNDDTFIPCEIIRTSDTALFQTVDNVVRFLADHQNILPNFYSIAQVKTLVWKERWTNSGFGAGANPARQTIQLPNYAHPLKFRILEYGSHRTSPFIFKLFFVVAGEEYLVATIAVDNTNSKYGTYEALINPPSGAIDKIFANPDAGAEWDGQIIIEKSGTLEGFPGLIMIDYI